MLPVITKRPTKIICVGRNYADHAKELGNDVPDNPLLFIKPPSSLATTQEIDLQDITQQNKLGELHFECELCVQIGTTTKNITKTNALSAISGVTLGLDLTLRNLQNELKQKGHPWERAKAFDDACLLGDWLPTNSIKDFKKAQYSLSVDSELRQQGNTALMLFPIDELIVNISKVFTLEAGDVIMTGTPKGVGSLSQGNKLNMQLETLAGTKDWQITVI